MNIAGNAMRSPNQLYDLKRSGEMSNSDQIESFCLVGQLILEFESPVAELGLARKFQLVTDTRFDVKSPVVNDSSDLWPIYRSLYLR